MYLSIVMADKVTGANEGTSSMDANKMTMARQFLMPSNGITRNIMDNGIVKTPATKSTID
jgi:hypothetical protein